MASYLENLTIVGGRNKMKEVTKRRHILMIALVLVLGLVIYTGIQVYTNHRERVEEERREEELRMELNELERILIYAENMFFDHNFRDRSVLSPLINVWNRGMGDQTVEFNEIVFVHSEAEAEGFGEDVVVLWPTEGSEIMLEFINSWLDPEVRGAAQHADYVGTEVIDLASLEIELPLTLDFMVDEWERMNEIFHLLNELRNTSNNLVGDALTRTARSRWSERERQAASDETDDPTED